MKLGVDCDPGRAGCVLRGRVYFPFAPEKNTPEMNEAAGKPDADASRRRHGASGRPRKP